VQRRFEAEPDSIPFTGFLGNLFFCPEMRLNKVFARTNLVLASMFLLPDPDPGRPKKPPTNVKINGKADSSL
jgi:hypothetical protein